MKFNIKLINSSGCRIGVLSGLRNSPESTYETPLSVFVTKSGSLPHLTPDVYHDSFSNTSVLCIPAQHFTSQTDIIQAYKKGVASFAALGSHPVCVIIQDPTTKTPSGYNDSTSVSVWDSKGRNKLSTESYFKLVKAMIPDWYEALNDTDTPKNASRKRIEKSLKNSLKFLEECQKCHELDKEMEGIGIFGALLGGHNPEDRSKWSDMIKEKEFDGYSLLGFHENGRTAEDVDVGSLRKCAEASLREIRKDKVRQAQGAFSPRSVLELVECGVDLFDSSSAYLASERGSAFCFNSNLESVMNSEAKRRGPSEVERSKENDSEHRVERSPPLNEVETSSYKKAKVVDGVRDPNGGLGSIRKTSDPSLTEAESKLPVNEHRPYEINLKDKRYANLKEPLVEGCRCYSCTNFTKAYVHHLLTVREMLASVLLMIHNLHQWELFFGAIREAIKTNNFNILKKFFVDTNSVK